MQSRLSVDEILELAAEHGKMEATVRINSKRKVADLLAEGLNVSRRGSLYYFINWGNAIVEGLPESWTTEKLFKDRKDLTQAQRLWLMSIEASADKLAKDIRKSLDRL